mmetsp:Transcript_77063/g.226012  ORF Transcript_77063/g.226012 Transcript_77063/m.226012 type:complete len:404 (-) Transcript_77063:255-1466(-)
MAGLSHHVPHSLCLDILGPVCVLQRVVSVLVVQMQRAHICNHHRAAVSAQGVLQEPCHLRVPVRHEGHGGAQSGDAVPQSEQRPVDVCALDHPQALVVRMRGPLRTRKVNHGELAEIDLRNDTCSAVSLFHHHLEHRVAAGACDVCTCRLSCAVAVGLVQQGHDLVSALKTTNLADAGNAHPLDRILADVEVVGIRPKEVADVLVVHLKEGTLDFEVPCFSLGGDLAKKVEQSQHHDARHRWVPEHRVRLPCTSGTIGKDSRVEPMEYAPDQESRGALVHLPSVFSLVESLVKSVAPLLRLVDAEVVISSRGLRILQGHGLPVCHLDDCPASGVSLLRVQRPATHSHEDVVPLVRSTRRACSCSIGLSLLLPKARSAPPQRIVTAERPDLCCRLQRPFKADEA